MDCRTMINLLSIRLADAKNIVFTDPVKLTALNAAQIKLAHKLHPSYLSELQVLETALTATAGVYAMTSLAYSVLKGDQGILKVKLNGGNYCTRIDIRDLKVTENIYLDGSDENPLYYVWKNTIYIISGQTNPSIDVFYLKIPNDMFYKIDISAHGTPSTSTFLGDESQGLSTTDSKYVGVPVYSTKQSSWHVVSAYDAIGTVPGTNDRAFTVVPAASANFGDDEIYMIVNDWDDLTVVPTTADATQHLPITELNPSLHNIVVDIAEAQCWRMDAQRELEDAANARAELLINTLNERRFEAEGIGTVGEKERQKTTQK